MVHPPITVALNPAGDVTVSYMQIHPTNWIFPERSGRKINPVHFDWQRPRLPSRNIIPSHPIPIRVQGLWNETSILVQNALKLLVLSLDCDSSARLGPRFCCHIRRTQYDRVPFASPLGSEHQLRDACRRSRLHADRTCLRI